MTWACLAGIPRPFQLDTRTVWISSNAVFILLTVDQLITEDSERSEVTRTETRIASQRRVQIFSNPRTTSKLRYLVLTLNDAGWSYGATVIKLRSARESTSYCTIPLVCLGGF